MTSENTPQLAITAGPAVEAVEVVKVSDVVELIKAIETSVICDDDEPLDDTEINVFVSDDEKLMAANEDADVIDIDADTAAAMGAAATAAVTANDYALTPTQIREFREGLSLSRRMVMEQTGLSGSVVWRAEQEGKSVSVDQRVTIIDFLHNVDQSVTPKPSKTVTAKTKTTKTANASTVRSMSVEENNALALANAEIVKLNHELADLEDNAQALLDVAKAKHDDFVAKLTACVDDALAVAKTKKQSTAGLNTVKAFIAG